jgi:hypothetical protein
MGDGNPTLKVTLKIEEKPSTLRERPHHQINPNDQITTQSPINIHIQEKENIEIENSNTCNNSQSIHFQFSNCPNISIVINKNSIGCSFNILVALPMEIFYFC